MPPPVDSPPVEAAASPVPPVVEAGGAAADSVEERGICLQDRLVGFLTSGDELLVTELGGTWVLEHNEHNGPPVPAAAVTDIKAQAMDKASFRAFIRQVHKACESGEDDGETTGSESSSNDEDEEDGEFVPADEDDDEDEEDESAVSTTAMAGSSGSVITTTDDAPSHAHNAGVTISSGRDVYYRCSFGGGRDDAVGDVGDDEGAPSSATASRADSS